MVGCTLNLAQMGRSFGPIGTATTPKSLAGFPKPLRAGQGGRGVPPNLGDPDERMALLHQFDDSPFSGRSDDWPSEKCPDSINASGQLLTKNPLEAKRSRRKTCQRRKRTPIRCIR